MFSFETKKKTRSRDSAIPHPKVTNQVRAFALEPNHRTKFQFCDQFIIGTVIGSIWLLVLEMVPTENRTMNFTEIKFFHRTNHDQKLTNQTDTLALSEKLVRYLKLVRLSLKQLAQLDYFYIKSQTLLKNCTNPFRIYIFRSTSPTNRWSYITRCSNPKPNRLGLALI